MRDRNNRNFQFQIDVQVACIVAASTLTHCRKGSFIDQIKTFLKVC